MIPNWMLEDGRKFLRQLQNEYALDKLNCWCLKCSFVFEQELYLGTNCHYVCNLPSPTSVAHTHGGWAGSITTRQNLRTRKLDDIRAYRVLLFPRFTFDTVRENPC